MGDIHGDIFNASVWGMMVGDMGGIVLVLSLAVLLVNKLRPPSSSPSHDRLR